tara:strand:+ start:796 stop:1095 length:300 start_codon:yes stop_codon:yes gene_type:complete
MALFPVTPTFSSPSQQEIVLMAKRNDAGDKIGSYAVCWEVHEGTRYVCNLLEDPEDILFIPKDRPITPGCRGRHIGWDAHADAVIVRDDRFDNSPIYRG